MIHRMIIKTTVHPDGGLYSMGWEATLETPATLHATANSLFTDGFYNDASWYDARAREVKTTKFIEHGSVGNCGDWEDLRCMMGEPERKALWRIYQKIGSQKIGRACRSKNGLRLYYCTIGH